MPARLVLGIMSGTSADGIDVAAVHIAGRGLAMRAHFVAHLHRPFTPGLRRRILQAMAPAATRTEELARLHADLGEAFAAAARAAIRKMPARPDLIGLAGQTVCHLPDRCGQTVTWQLGDPARVAARTGITTVAEFRQSDVAAGGQGAPLVPWTDYILFRSNRQSRLIQNIGGIGNVTWLPAGARPADVLAFDTGPGNMIVDALVARVTHGRERFDRDGRRAARGRVLPDVLQAWLKHPFLRRSPPKSTGRETFGSLFIDREIKRLRAASRSPDDWIATATAFTAHSIAQAYRFIPDFKRYSRKSEPEAQARDTNHKSEPEAPARDTNAARRSGPAQSVPRLSRSGHALQSVPRLLRSGHAERSEASHRAETLRRAQSDAIELIVCGGGARNATLLAMLSGALPRVPIRSIDSLGIPAEAKEALSFAILAAAHIDSVPANLPQVTGAARPTLLGTCIRADTQRNTD